ncbi:MAG: NAD(P)H-hydrate dehydratase [Acidobacteria bacterium]|nr:NAD(P)H-hydrate dehydratase [Acidobacteriota bacterium]
MRVLTTAQMQAADRATIETVGLASTVLMENAGRQVVAAMERRVPGLYDRRIAVLCGKGHNGGDGFVVARVLAGNGAAVSVYLMAAAETVTGDARAHLTALDAWNLGVIEVADAAAWGAAMPAIAACDLIVDALFGTGLSGRLVGHAAEVVHSLNATGVPIISIDLPSGLSGDTGAVPGPSIDATMTVALGAPKVSSLLPPAATRVGELAVADIGIPDSVIESVAGPRVEVATTQWAQAQLAPRPDELHKGDCGRVLIVAGSVGKTGAAHLAALGALRSGAGLVTVATPRVCQDVVSAMMPEYMTLGLECEPDGTLAAGAADAVLAERCDVLAVGPGLGQGPGVQQVVRTILERSQVPVVLDADALNAFSHAPEALVGRVGHDVIVTPHPGEMARLTGATIEHVQRHRLEVARGLAIAQHLYVVLKGARTLIASPDGSVFINVTGNPGMATGGTGDVLTGVIAAWMAQLGDATTACALGVHVHGLAGDLAAEQQGEVGMIASDLAGQLGPAVRRLQRGDSEAGTKTVPDAFARLSGA